MNEHDSSGEPTAVADDGDETTVVADAGPTQAAGLAWSDCDDDYTIVASPPGTETMAGDALDLEDLWTDDDDREYASTTVKLWVGLMAVVVIAAGWIGYMFLTHHDDDNAPAPAPASAAPTSTATQTPVAAAAPSSPDDTVVPSTAAPTSTVTVTQTPEPQAAPTVTEEAPPLPPITVQAPPPAAAPSADDEFISRLQADQITVYDRARVLHTAHRICWAFDHGYSRPSIAAAVKNADPDLTDIGLADLVSLSVDYYCPQYAGM